MHIAQTIDKGVFAYNIPRIRVADEGLVMEHPMYVKLMQKRDSISYAWENQLVEFTLKSKGALVIVGSKWCGKSTTAN